MLPLKEEMKVAMETQPLAARFHDVHPSLLLFLHRLRHLAVVNKVGSDSSNLTDAVVTEFHCMPFDGASLASR